MWLDKRDTGESKRGETAGIEIASAGEMYGVGRDARGELKETENERAEIIVCVIYRN